MHGVVATDITHLHNHAEVLDGHPITCVGDPSQPPGPKNFRLCWQVFTSDAHANHIGIDSPATTGPCVYLGEATGETTGCTEGCGNGTRLKLFQCAIHGICTLGKRGERGGCCKNGRGEICTDYKASERFKLVASANGIGDNLMSLTLFAAWKRTHPDAKLIIVGQQKEWIDLFENDGVSSLARGKQIYAQLNEDARDCEFAGALARIPDRERALPTLKPLPAASIEWAWQHAGKIVLVPCAANVSREWSLDRWLALEQRLEDCVVIGPEHQRGNLARFTSPWFAGRSPSDVAALIRVARLVVANDSGMAHLAGLLNVPCVCVVGGDWGRRVHEFYKKTTVLIGDGHPDSLLPADVAVQIRRKINFR